MEDYKKITGWNTPAEMAAYEKGKKHEEELIIRFICAWNGETNSILGQILSDKFIEFSKARNGQKNAGKLKGRYSKGQGVNARG